MYFTIKTSGIVVSFYTHKSQGRDLVSLAIRMFGRHWVLNWTRHQFERMCWVGLVLYLMS